MFDSKFNQDSLRNVRSTHVMTAGVRMWYYKAAYINLSIVTALWNNKVPIPYTFKWPLGEQFVQAIGLIIGQ